MLRESDFHQELERAAGHVLDATCALRDAGLLPLPPPQRQKLRTAIVAAERLQQHLFTLRNDPWSEPSRPKSTQLALL